MALESSASEKAAFPSKTNRRTSTSPGSQRRSWAGSERASSDVERETLITSTDFPNLFIYPALGVRTAGPVPHFSRPAKSPDWEARGPGYPLFAEEQCEGPCWARVACRGGAVFPRERGASAGLRVAQRKNPRDRPLFQPRLRAAIRSVSASCGMYNLRSCLTRVFVIHKFFSIHPLCQQKPTRQCDELHSF